MSTIFEAVDATSDEQYFTVGLWPTLAEAVEVFEKRGNNPIGEHSDDVVKVEIRERKVGKMDLSETGKVVAKFVWLKDYREADDSYEWRRETVLTDGK